MWGCCLHRAPALPLRRAMVHIKRPLLFPFGSRGPLLGAARYVGLLPSLPRLPRLCNNVVVARYSTHSFSANDQNKDVNSDELHNQTPAVAHGGSKAMRAMELINQKQQGLLLALKSSAFIPLDEAFHTPPPHTTYFFAKGLASSYQLLRNRS